MFLIWCAFLVVVVWRYLRQTYSRFNGTGVRHHKIFPFLGNMWRMIFKVDQFVEDLDRVYYNFPEERFVGRYEFSKPVVMVRDLELVRRVAIKDFEHFVDHRVFISAHNDPLFGRNLLSLRGQEWKDMRSTLSPAFTGSKIKMMVPFMVQVGNQMISALKQKIQASKDGYIDLDVKDLTTRYATDVIASCAFGLEVDSHTEVNNQFYAEGKKASELTLRQFLVFFAYSSIPKIMNFLKISILSKATTDFFRGLVVNMMRHREKQRIVRPDMIHLLMEAQKGKLTHDDGDRNSDKLDAGAGFATVEESSVGKKEVNRVWSDDDLTAQAVLFFISGFEASSTTMSFLLHELGLHPEVQERLLREIRQLDETTGGEFDYNAIQNMKYLDMVVSELLRLWVPLPALDRLCTQDYNMGRPNDKATEDFILRKGEGMQIPVWSFHRDPQYFPDPLKFDPERFSDENKHKIKPFTYMPFGLGPRNCIASRFALCQMKVMTYQLLREFQVSPAAKTQVPVKLSKDTFFLKAEGGHWVRFDTRKYGLQYN